MPPDGTARRSHAAGPTTEIVHLSDANAPERVALTTLAFPGFFRKRTCEMGCTKALDLARDLMAN